MQKTFDPELNRELQEVAQKMNYRGREISLLVPAPGDFSMEDVVHHINAGSGFDPRDHNPVIFLNHTALGLKPEYRQAIVAHEVAHIMLGHNDEAVQARKNGVGTPITELHAREYAADRLAFERGFDIIGAAKESMRLNSFYAYDSDGTHPGMADRVAALEKLSRERARKAAA